jgi:hypothetical protein
MVYQGKDREVRAIYLLLYREASEMSSQAFSMKRKTLRPERHSTRHQKPRCGQRQQEVPSDLFTRRRLKLDH